MAIKRAFVGARTLEPSLGTESNDTSFVTEARRKLILPRCRIVIIGKEAARVHSYPILVTEVRVTNSDPVFAEKLLEQYGGATGELTAALTYWTQSFHTDHRGVRDMLQDIGTEEFSHLEVTAMLIEQHTQRASLNVQEAAYKRRYDR